MSALDEDSHAKGIVLDLERAAVAVSDHTGDYDGLLRAPAEGYPIFMEVRRLTEDDAQVFRDFRLSALATVPEAFGESAEEYIRTPVETIAERIRAGGEESFILGSFAEAELAGTVGFYRDPRMKRRQRG